MKKAIFFAGIIFVLFSGVVAQLNKTNLSLQVSAAATANRVKLASNVWTRTVQVFSGGILKKTIVSSLSVGSNGKMVYGTWHALVFDFKWDESFDIGSDTLTPVDDEDYASPLSLTAKLKRLTILIDRPQLSPEDVKRLKRQ
jgi:hypothetical protein